MSAEVLVPTGPIAEDERIGSLDVLRGVAVLGILVMNVRDFGMPLRAFDNPAFPDGFTWANFVAWIATNLFFQDKMIAIFSMLFGAGILVFTERAEARGAPVAGLYYRRQLWLLLFGIIHTYGFWFGDVLTTYSVCAMVLFPLRRLSPRLLLAGGFLVFSVAILFRQWPAVYDRVASAVLGPLHTPTKAPMSDAEAYRGTWLALFRWRAWLNTYWHVDGALGYDFWRCSGFMMAGMGLMKLRVFEALRSARFHRNLMLLGFGIGLPLAAFAIWESAAAHKGIARRFGIASLAPGKPTAMLLAGAAVALGHVGLVMEICRRGLFPRARAALAATGRMALTNYLGQTLVCVLVFDGWAFGQWGRFGIAAQLLLVLAIWVAQLALSPLWLRRFWFGPMEWLWRSLTYWKRQPWSKGSKHREHGGTRLCCADGGHAMRKVRVPGSLLVALLALAVAQATSAQVAPGFRLYGPYNGTDTYLVDPNGVTVHTWPSVHLPGAAVYLRDDGDLLRTIRTPGGPSIGGTGGGVVQMALDGTVLWEFHYDGPQHWSHHDIEPMPNGNVLMIAWENYSVGQAIAAGRDPALIQGNVMRVDTVIEVQPTGPTTGTIVWKWNLWDHLVQNFDPSKANYGSVAAHPELVSINYPKVASEFGDWNHMNSVKYDPVHDRILLSARGQNEIWVIDHSTTTAQAAGHTGGTWGKGGDLLYRYGNPECYAAGGPGDRVFFGQHSARFIPPGYPGAGNITVFNNNPPAGTSTVWELVPPMDAAGNFVLTPGSAYGPSAPVWTYSDPGFDSMFMSSAQRLPNGNTLICSALQARVFEVTPAGQTVWSSTLGTGTAIFHAHYAERTLWTEPKTVDASTGGLVTFTPILGTAHAGDGYLLLASASGTMPGIPIGGVTLPLNFDGLMVYTFANANAAPLAQSAGVLDAHGRATASLLLPPGLAAPGAVHFACAIVEPAVLTLVAATNAVPISVVP
jgi:uncharacterized membrane protein YeiB